MRIALLPCLLSGLVGFHKQFPILVTLAYKFLVFNPLFAHSHTNFLGKIADTLTEAGHDVVGGRSGRRPKEII